MAYDGSTDKQISNNYSSQESISGKPDFSIPEAKKDANWYMRNIRYYCNFYNQSTSAPSVSNPIEGYGPVTKGLFFYNYLLGKQENLDFNFIVTDPTRNTQQASWQKGKKVKQLIDHLKGNITQQLEAKEISTISLSKSVTSSKKRKLEDLMLKYDTAAQKVFAQLEQIGIKFSPEIDKVFENKEQAQRYMEYDFKENVEIIAQDIAKHIEIYNDANTMYAAAFEDFCASNYCAIYTRVEGGNIIQERIPFFNVIYDNTTTDKFVRKGRFAGYIERLTPEEIFSKYDDQLTEEQKAEIKKIASEGVEDRTLIESLNTFPTLTWWNYRQNQMLITVVHMFWIGRRDTRYDLSIDKFGNAHYYKMGDKKKGKQGKFIIDDVYKGTLIGNRYLVDYGYAENVVRNPKDKSCPELPIKIFTNSTMMGDGVSPIGMVYQNQDRMDLYRYKIIESVGRDAGKGYLIRGEKLGDSVGSRELLTDLKSMGVHVYSGLSGEEGDMTNNSRLVELVDMTLDPNINQYINLYMEEERVMESVLSISKIALGQQTTYVGLGTQKGTIAQSAIALSSLFKDFVKFNEIVLQYATNLAKIAYTAPDAEQAPMIIGDRGVKLLELTKDFKFEDFLVYLKIKDIIDEAGKQRLLAYAQAWSQNPSFGIGPIEILRLEQASSYTQAINELEYSLKQKQKEMAQAAQVQHEREMQIQQQELDGKSEIEAMKQMAADDRNEETLKAKVFGDLVKADAKESGGNPTKGLPVKK